MEALRSCLSAERVSPFNQGERGEAGERGGRGRNEVRERPRRGRREAKTLASQRIARLEGGQHFVASRGTLGGNFLKLCGGPSTNATLVKLKFE